MAFESGWHWDETFQAGADLSTKQHLFVKGNGTTAGSVVVCSSQGEDAVGVLQNNPASTRDATVRLAGFTKVIAGEAIDAWAQVTVGADARAEVALTGDKIVGTAITAAADDGDIITVWLRTEPAVV